MLTDKLFIGQRQDLQHYKGIAIQDHEFEILDEDGDAVSFAEFDRVAFEIYAKPHGKLILETDCTLDASPVTNIASLSIPSEDLALRPTLYFYELVGIVDSSPEQRTLLSYGVLEML